jgi:putative CocE/NonD family hydrolase
VRGEWDFGDDECVLSDQEWLDFDTPALVCVGWWDEQTTIDSWMALTSSRGASKAHLLVGGWDHAGNNAPRPVLGGLDVSASAIDLFATIESFLATHLKPDAGGAELPRCRVFRTGAMEWDSLAEWPDPSAVPLSLYLRSGGAAQSMTGDGRLTTAPPGEAEPADCFEHDPASPERSLINLDLFAWSDPPLDQRFAQRRPTTLVYTSDPFHERMTVSGQAVLELFVSTDRQDADVYVEIADVYPDGRAITFTTGARTAARRLRYHDDGSEKLLEPGEVRRLTIPVVWLHHAFEPGHAVRLSVLSTAFPFRAVNQNGGGSWADETEPLIAHNALHHDQARPSRLLLPVVPAQERA